jgi:hypothetical protein
MNHVCIMIVECSLFLGGKEKKLKRDWLTGGLLFGAASRDGALSFSLHRGADCSGSGVCVYTRAHSCT